MKTTLTNARWVLAAAAFATCVAGVRPASASQPEALAHRLPARTFAELRREIAQARARDPRTFAIVADVVALAPQANQRARARRAPIALYLSRLGPAALMPMLEMLAVDPPRGVPAEAAPVLRRELIEAIGLLHDPKALSVLSAILDDADEDAETTRSAAEAIARVGTPEAAAKILTALASARDERALAIVAGMGECRRAEIAEALAERLRTTTDEAMVRAAARSIGRTASAWVWRVRADRGGEARIRETAARALVTAFVRHVGEARDAAANALLVVDAPMTPALIAEASRGASPDTAEALGRLAARLARNPIRR